MVAKLMTAVEFLLASKRPTPTASLLDSDAVCIAGEAELLTVLLSLPVSSLLLLVASCYCASIVAVAFNS